jgi:ribose transport system ATP-binding protein
MDKDLIRVSGLVKNFGSFRALDNMEFSLRKGEVHVLFGENGAGKSTLIQVLCGVHSYDAGDYTLLGQKVHHLTPAEVRALGISVVYQEFSLIPELTIEENLFLGQELTRFGRLDKRTMHKRVQEVFERLEFPLNPSDRVGQLRRAHQQMVEIAKALLTDCKVLILDEPTASLTDHEAEHLFEIVEQLRAEGLGIIYVSHRMAEIDRLADRITVLRDGKYIDTVDGKTSDHTQLVELMTGRKFDKFYPEIKHAPQAPILSIQNMTLENGQVQDVSFDIAPGEVLGIAGLAGCGKSEAIRALFGLETVQAGQVTLNGADLVGVTPRRALNAGICYFPSDRASEGLAMRQSLERNATMAALDDRGFSKGRIWLKRGKERRFTSEMIQSLRIRTPAFGASADQLSGGNKQKLMVARGLSRDFDIYLFDEPTVGVDVQAKLEIYDVIKMLAESGKAVVIVSSELSEVMHMSHRMLVMREGQIVGEMDGHEVDEESVLSLFFGHPSEESAAND